MLVANTTEQLVGDHVERENICAHPYPLLPSLELNLSPSWYYLQKKHNMTESNSKNFNIRIMFALMGIWWFVYILHKCEFVYLS